MTVDAKAVPTVVILNQYYVPDVASTGHLLHELATQFAGEGIPVKVTTCFPSYGPPETWQPCPAFERTAGVEVRRMRTTRFSKDNLFGRMLNSTTFVVPLLLRQLFATSRGHVYLYTSNPPYLGAIGGLIASIRRHPYVVLLHDSYPHVAIWVGKVRKGGLVDRLWHGLNRLMYRRAQHTIVLCRKAKELVCREYGLDPSRVHVIPNWADPSALFPIPKTESRFAREHGLVEPFTVLYSGNLGLYYEFDTILDAAARLQDENFRLVFVGSGGKRQYIADGIARRGLKNVLMLPYQPFEHLNESLNGCDASLVTIAEGIEGISFPSKLYSSLAVGKPVLAISEPDSELREVIEGERVGRWVALRDAEGLAEAIRGLMRDPEACRAMGRRARELMERRFAIDASARQYAEVLLSVQT